MFAKIYISFMRFLGLVLDKLGLINWLQNKFPHSKKIKYLISLLFVFDFKKLVEFDLAWWNFNVISKVDSFLKKTPNAKVFEYGSGASTIWLAKRAGHVTSVEFDESFFQEVSKELTAYKNTNLILRKPQTISGNFPSNKKGFTNLDFEDFVLEINQHEKFDLIIIDGRARELCFDEALKHLNENGIILFDDTHRKRYFDKISATTNINAEHIKGLTPSLPVKNQSSLIKALPQ